MEDSKKYREMMEFYSAIRLYAQMSDEEKGELIKHVKEKVEADEKENPNQPLNLIVSDTSEWPSGWSEIVKEIQSKLK